VSSCHHCAFTFAVFLEQIASVCSWKSLSVSFFSEFVGVVAYKASHRTAIISAKPVVCSVMYKRIVQEWHSQFSWSPSSAVIVLIVENC